MVPPVYSSPFSLKGTEEEEQGSDRRSESMYSITEHVLQIGEENTGSVDHSIKMGACQMFPHRLRLSRHGREFCLEKEHTLCVKMSGTPAFREKFCHAVIVYRSNPGSDLTLTSTAHLLLNVYFSNI